MKELIQVPAELQTFRTYATKRSVSLTFELQEEIDPEHLSQFLKAKGLTGWLVFNPTEERLKVEEIPDTVIDPLRQSSSQRLRAAIYHLWEQGGKEGMWSTFYEHKMSQIISSI